MLIVPSHCKLCMQFSTSIRPPSHTQLRLRPHHLLPPPLARSYQSMHACGTMSSSVSHDVFLTASSLLTLFNLLLLLLPASSALDEGLMLVEEDKVRLGSAPPNCHNRCNACTPCSAVEEPTTPARPSLVQPTPESSSHAESFSNYKPLGWKCRCGDRLFNP